MYLLVLKTGRLQRTHTATKTGRKDHETTKITWQSGYGRTPRYKCRHLPETTLRTPQMRHLNEHTSYPMAQIRATIISVRCRRATIGGSHSVAATVLLDVTAIWHLRIFSQRCCYSPVGRYSNMAPARILVSVSPRSILFPATPTKCLVLPNLFLPLGFIDNNSACVSQTPFSRASCSGTAAILWTLKTNFSCWMTSTTEVSFSYGLNLQIYANT
jgi:hypothetical protein